MGTPLISVGCGLGSRPLLTCRATCDGSWQHCRVLCSPCVLQHFAGLRPLITAKKASLVIGVGCASFYQDSFFSSWLALEQDGVKLFLLELYLAPGLVLPIVTQRSRAFYIPFLPSCCRKKIFHPCGLHAREKRGVSKGFPGCWVRGKQNSSPSLPLCL